MSSTVALALLLAGSAPATGIRWEKNFDVAMKKAQREGKPVVVDFWAEWCGWCHRLDNTTYADPVVADIARAFVAVKVNKEGGRRDVDVAERYEVYTLPTILFLSSQGRQLLRVNGFQGPGRFPRTLEQALEIAKQVHGWEDALRLDPNDPAALLALGQHMFEQEYYRESEELLRRAMSHDAGQPVPERRRARLLLAILQNVDRRYAEAETLIKEALSLGPKGEDEAKLLFVLGHTYVSWGRRDEGVQTMRVIVREFPGTPLAQKARETLVTLEPR